MKKSVSLSDQAVAAIQMLSLDSKRPEWSRVINQQIEASMWLFRSSLPDLSDAEWEYILNAYAGSWEPMKFPPYRVASDLMDHEGVLDVNDHPMPDLVRRIHAMSQAEQYAILMFVQMFWRNDWNHHGTFGEIRDAILGGGDARD